MLAWTPVASASCLQVSTQEVLDGSPAAIIGTVTSREQETVTLDVERVLKGGLPTGPVTLANPVTSVQFSGEVGERVGLGLSPTPSPFPVTDCLRADPEALTLAAGSRPRYVVGGRGGLLLLDSRGRLQRKVTGLGGTVTALSRDRQPGVIAVRTAAGWAQRDLFSGRPLFAPHDRFRPNRQLRVRGRMLRRGKHRLARLPAGRWTSAIALPRR